jgi:hypothetical protein
MTLDISSVPLFLHPYLLDLLCMRQICRVVHGKKQTQQQYIRKSVKINVRICVRKNVKVIVKKNI